MEAKKGLLLDGVDYYQVVFTLPSDLSSLALGNRREIYNLLFQSAWAAIKQTVETEQGYQPAALMVLAFSKAHTPGTKSWMPTGMFTQWFRAVDRRLMEVAGGRVGDVRRNRMERQEKCRRRKRPQIHPARLPIWWTRSRCVAVIAASS
jgi:hypothetical protein